MITLNAENVLFIQYESFKMLVVKCHGCSTAENL